MNASGVGVKVPEIYYAFQYKGQTHIVMEYVNGETVGSWLQGSSVEEKNWTYDQLAKAINHVFPVIHVLARLEVDAQFSIASFETTSHPRTTILVTSCSAISTRYYIQPALLAYHNRFSS